MKMEGCPLARESLIERKVCAYANSRGWIPMKLGGTGDRGKPDRVFAGPGGRTVYIEFKAPGGHVTKLQEWYIERLRERGHEAHIIDNVEAGNAIFD